MNIDFSILWITPDCKIKYEYSHLFNRAKQFRMFGRQIQAPCPPIESPLIARPFLVAVVRYLLSIFPNDFLRDVSFKHAVFIHRAVNVKTKGFVFGRYDDQVVLIC